MLTSPVTPNVKRFAKPVKLGNRFRGFECLSVLEANAREVTSQTRSFRRVADSSTRTHSTPSSRMEANESGPDVPPARPYMLLADLQSIVDAWGDVDPSLRPGIVAMVLTTARRGGGK
jgi:hypothetical protein